MSFAYTFGAFGGSAPEVTSGGTSGLPVESLLDDEDG
jgi:hypothetical protein